MSTMIENWTSREFLAFVALYGANADAKITDDERDWICRQFGEDCFAKVFAVFNSQSDYENIQIILQLKERHFPGTAGDKAIQDHLQKVFAVDQKYDAMEKAVLHALKKLF